MGPMDIAPFRRSRVKWHACLDTVLTFERKPQFFPVLELMPPEAAR